MEVMGKQNQVGISIDGGVITLEPGCSKARFWVRETVPRLIFGLTLGDDLYAFGEPRSPVYIVIWNPTRTVEYYREGPYKGTERDKKLDQLREEIANDGLSDVLFRRQHRTDTP
jgi:hypothetical protein